MQLKRGRTFCVVTGMQCAWHFPAKGHLCGSQRRGEEGDCSLSFFSFSSYSAAVTSTQFYLVFNLWVFQPHPAHSDSRLIWLLIAKEQTEADSTVHSLNRYSCLHQLCFSNNVPLCRVFFFSYVRRAHKKSRKGSFAVCWVIPDRLISPLWCQLFALKLKKKGGAYA